MVRVRQLKANEKGRPPADTIGQHHGPQSQMLPGARTTDSMLRDQYPQIMSELTLFLSSYSYSFSCSPFLICNFATHYTPIYSMSLLSDCSVSVMDYTSCHRIGHTTKSVGVFQCKLCMQVCAHQSLKRSRKAIDECLSDCAQEILSDTLNPKNEEFL